MSKDIDHSDNAQSRRDQMRLCAPCTQASAIRLAKIGAGKLGSSSFKSTYRWPKS